MLDPNPLERIRQASNLLSRHGQVPGTVLDFRFEPLLVSISCQPDAGNHNQSQAQKELIKDRVLMQSIAGAEVQPDRLARPG